MVVVKIYFLIYVNMYKEKNPEDMLTVGLGLQNIFIFYITYSHKVLNFFNVSMCYFCQQKNNSGKYILK